MPALQSSLIELNTAFSPSNIEAFAAANAETFAPGGAIQAELITRPGTVLHRALESYLAGMPHCFHVSLRAILHYAVSARPPVPITFAWAPGYDFELNIWQAPDTAETRGGVTVLIKGRYPADPHPLAPKAGA